MYRRPKIENYIYDDLPEFASEWITVAPSKIKREIDLKGYLAALEEYCNFLEGELDTLVTVGTPPSSIRIQAEKIETLNRFVKAYSDSFYEAQHALMMAIEDATECSVDWEKYIDKRNARDLYKSCELCLKDTDSPNKKIRIIAMFYELLAAEESKQ